MVAARALDGIVEGIEDPDRWYLGVQWHPEDDDGPAADRLRLFDAFVTACEAAAADPRLQGWPSGRAARELLGWRSPHAIWRVTRPWG